MKALSASPVHFKNLSDSGDTVMLKRALKIIRVCAKSSIPTVIYTGNAGTVTRFLTAYLAQYEGKWLLTGNKRMNDRPISMLVDALNMLGADIKYTGNKTSPPLLINGTKLSGGTVAMEASKSSQFISALMLIAPYLNNPLRIVFDEKPVSFPYIVMTARLMEGSGVDVRYSEKEVSVSNGDYNLTGTDVEKDWSSAAFWYQTVALDKKSRIFLKGLSPDSIQGDKILVDVFEKLGVSTKFEKGGATISYSGDITKLFEYDFSDCPDIVPPVMAACAASGIKAIFKGIEHLRHKESDRIEKMNTELNKTGASIVKQNDNYLLLPGKRTQETIVFDTHGDHRIAMSLAPLSIVFNKITINNPEVVEKSYPQYWNQLANSGIVTVKKA